MRTVRLFYIGIFAALVCTSCGSTTLYYQQNRPNAGTYAIPVGGGDRAKVFDGFAYDFAADRKAKLFVRKMGRQIQIAPLSESDPSWKAVVNEDRGVFIRDFAIDEKRGHLYWSKEASFSRISCEIWRCDLATGRHPVLIMEGARGTFELEIDSFRRKLYWKHGLAGQVHGQGIWRANLDGSNAKMVVSSPGAGGFTIAPVCGTIFWHRNSRNKGEILAANLNGENQRKFAETQGFVESMKVDGCHIYWADRTYGTGVGRTTRLMRSRLNGTGVQELRQQPYEDGIFGAVAPGPKR